MTAHAEEKEGILKCLEGSKMQKSGGAVIPMDNKDIVSKVREFNRFYMPKMNLLGIII